LFHKFIEVEGSKEREKAVQEIMNFILDRRADLENLRKNYGSEYKMLDDYYTDFVKFIEHIDITKLGTSLDQAKKKVKDHFAGYNLKKEQNLALKNSNGYWITGRLDAFYYKDDGSGIIVDYKTSVKKSWTSTTEFEYYM
jgi:ATP-dependent exoDNAse (exonuclease V) beta subunit